MTYSAPPAAYAAPQPPTAPKTRNVLGIIALAVAALGFVFACIPGALIVGWILLPIGFILGIVAVCLRGKVKWQAITAIIVSVVGTIVGFIVFFAVVAASFTNAFGDSGVDIDNGTAVVEEGDDSADEGASETGTRDNPAALGATIEGDEWTVVINSVELDAVDAVLEENDFNDKPDPGTTYIGINYTVTYTGDDADGQYPAMVGLEYVTGDGVTVDGLDKLLIGPDELDTISPIYEGASVTGNRFIQVPDPVDGVLAVTPGMFSDKVFVATK